jgi:predicted aspartyl protease
MDMETATMGRVLVKAKIENLSDVHAVERGQSAENEVRTVEVSDALVDTGATALSLPKSLIVRLGLTPGRQRRARTTAGPRMVQTYGAVRLTIQDRDCYCDVAELPEDCPVLIGQLPLEMLDFVVDLAGQKLIGNPEHGGERMIDLY